MTGTERHFGRAPTDSESRPAVATTSPAPRVGAETIDLRAGNRNVALLIHGFADTPQTLGLLAAVIHGSGVDVRAPLLPGHGTTVADFMMSRRSDWMACVRAELAGMRTAYERVTIIGLSMGGALAAILAAETPDAAALVLLAPYLNMPIAHKVAAATHWIWGRLAGARQSRSPRSILDSAERMKNLGYGVYSARLLYELWRISTQARGALREITVPTLLVHSRADPRIAPSIAEHAFSLIGAADKKLAWAEGGGHVITVDFGRDEVFRNVTEWMAKHP
ncbi:MAG: alpha/beta fold hydrolase [Gemmatimonadaceae bacterium]